MVLAFLLMVSVDKVNFGEEQDMVFKDIYRCWHFARIFEHGGRSPNYTFKHGNPVKAYCVPLWVNKDTNFQD
jgi:hypothetical protein|tara:strand:- start:1687 stop:1902 length:216 start_codon:yes stop_codon:yes gene_type:complete